MTIDATWLLVALGGLVSCGIVPSRRLVRYTIWTAAVIAQVVLLQVQLLLEQQGLTYITAYVVYAALASDLLDGIVGMVTPDD